MEVLKYNVLQTPHVISSKTTVFPPTTKLTQRYSQISEHFSTSGMGLTSIISAIVLASSGVSYLFVVRAPKVTIPRDERAKDFLSKYMDALRYLATFYQALIVSIFVAEGAALLHVSRVESPFVKALTTPMMTRLCSLDAQPRDGSVYPGGQLTITTTIACFFMISGAFFRYWAQVTCDQFFTWELAIRPGHKLCTRGPYSIVRHPSYTGLFAVYVAHLLFGFSRHTLMRECTSQTYPLPYQVFCGVVICIQLMIYVTIPKRMPKEDEMLKKEFGKEWEEWATKTKHKVIPGIW